jgi:hypothetical protein
MAPTVLIAAKISHNISYSTNTNSTGKVILKKKQQQQQQQPNKQPNKRTFV